MTFLLERLFREAGISQTYRQLEMFDKYAELLLEWNEKMNLTAITEKEEIAVKHFFDSLSLLEYLGGTDDCRLIDIGSGAGFPGMPLKIMRPRLKLTLMDSLQKRIRFLCELKERLELTGVECVHMRAEDGAHDGMYREKFDICVSRAVAGLDILSAYCMAYVKPGGLFIAMKGPNAGMEITAADEYVKLMGGEINTVKTVKLPLSDIKRSIVLIDKVRQTPPEYPKKLLKHLKRVKK